MSFLALLINLMHSCLSNNLFIVVVTKYLTMFSCYASVLGFFITPNEKQHVNISLSLSGRAERVTCVTPCPGQMAERTRSDLPEQSAESRCELIVSCTGRNQLEPTLPGWKQISSFSPNTHTHTASAAKSGDTADPFHPSGAQIQNPVRCHAVCGLHRQLPSEGAC